MTLFFNMHWLIPVAVVLGLVYVVYFAIRTIVATTGGSAPSVTYTAAPPPQNVTAKARKSRPKGSEAIRAGLARRDWSERLSEIVAAMLTSTVVAAVLSFVILLLGHESAAITVRSGAMYAWILATTLPGTWSVLIFGKLWESSSGDAVHRRFVMLVVGLGVGLVAWGGHAFLHVGSSASRW